MTVDSEAVGVSLEVGATYRPAIGDTVRWGESTETFTVRVPDEGNGEVVVSCDVDGKFFVFCPDDLVRVVPTPADQWLVFNGPLDKMMDIFDAADDALTAARDWASACPTGGPYRIARFAFAGWVGEQSDG